MSRISYTLLSAMPSVVDFKGDKHPAAGYYGHTKGLHTISITVHNFKGQIAIQGSQALAPTENDWFPVTYPFPFFGMPSIEYPRMNVPHRNPNLRNGGETSTFGFSFRVNCLWLRATVSRQYLLPISLPTYASNITSDPISWLGTVDNILVNY